MKTIQEQIEVMQHFANGGEVEFYSNFNKRWEESSTPVWDWRSTDYRIKEQKKTIAIEKWLICKTSYMGNECLEIIEGNSTLFDGYYDKSVKVKLLETYEVEL